MYEWWRWRTLVTSSITRSMIRRLSMEVDVRSRPLFLPISNRITNPNKPLGGECDKTSSWLFTYRSTLARRRCCSLPWSKSPEAGGFDLYSHKWWAGGHLVRGSRTPGNSVFKLVKMEANLNKVSKTFAFWLHRTGDTRSYSDERPPSLITEPRLCKPVQEF